MSQTYYRDEPPAARPAARQRMAELYYNDRQTKLAKRDLGKLVTVFLSLVAVLVLANYLKVLFS